MYNLTLDICAPNAEYLRWDIFMKEIMMEL